MITLFRRALGELSNRQYDHARHVFGGPIFDGGRRSQAERL
jgi:hypothetical protein